MFRGEFANTVPLTVLSQRAGLVMNPDASVKLLGVRVGRVASIETRPQGQAAIHLEMDPAGLAHVPANVRVDITSTTVFGAKSVNLIPPANPSKRTLHAGQVLDASHVTVEWNTTFQQLTSVLSKIQPEKLNATLGAISSALGGRGEKIGQALSDLDRLLAKLDPSLRNLGHDIEVAPKALNAYADVAADLLTTADNASQLGQTIVDQQHNLDAVLLSAIGLADTGNDVLGTNRQAITDTLRLLAPTTDLTKRYNQALTCGLQGLSHLASGAPFDEPGVVTLSGIQLGTERYRYPANLPKVGARGGPQCTGLPAVPPNGRPPFVVTDIGANPAQYGNQGILLNSDALKQLLFGPLDGPPRNSSQAGQPG
jgi:phospholipid/cholesterol/gamma-HCH transport system substrate-binding protein